MAIAGYSVVPGSSITGENATVAVIRPDGSIDTSTQIPNASTTIGTSNSVKAVASADGLGFYVATNDFISMCRSATVRRRPPHRQPLLYRQ